MLLITKRQIKAWCKLDGQPGYVLTNGQKVKQSACKIIEVLCEGCNKSSHSFDDPHRYETYIQAHELCPECHAEKLFPNDEEARDKFYLNTVCKASIGRGTKIYWVDYMLHTCRLARAAGEWRV